MTGTCPKCHQVRPLSRHHKLPRRIRRPRSNEPQQVILICFECHQRLEVRLRRREEEIVRRAIRRYNPHLVALLRENASIYEDELRRFLA